MTQQLFGAFTLKLVSTHSHSNFIYLHPEEACDAFAVKLQYGPQLEKVFYSSLHGGSGVAKGCVGCSTLLAQRLHFQEDEKVFVSGCAAKSLKTVSVRPDTEDDYQILANVQSLMEYVMMDQVRIVAPNQKLPLKIGNIIVDLFVENLSPAGECGRLEKYTEVEILEPSSRPELFSVVPSSSTSSVSDVIWRFVKWGLEMWRPGDTEDHETVKKPYPKEAVRAALRHPSTPKTHYRVVLEQSGSNVSDVLYVNQGFKKEPTLCKISVLQERNLTGKNEKAVNCEIECLVALREGNVVFPELYVTRDFMRKLKVSVGSRVTIQQIPKEKTADSDKKEEVTKAGEVPVFQDTADIHLWESCDQIFDQIINLINCSVPRFDAVRTKNLSSNALVTGPIGCGKSVFLKKISMFCLEKGLYCKIVQCKLLRGKTVEGLLKVLSSKFSKCAYREPSVLLLDDVDELLSITGEGGEDSNVAYCKRVATILSDLWEGTYQRASVCLVATASSVSRLGPLTSSRGPRLFQLVTKIPEMNAKERSFMLSKLGITCSESIVEKTSGYRIQDLADLISRAKLNRIIQESGQGDAQVSVENVLLEAMSDTKPISLQGVSLQTKLPHTWQDVGGCTDVKKSLEEQFKWPTEFPEVFKSCPLTLQTGALLYGAPGTGKTLLAAALANECGINFISVKGPELLSKYVGASEAAVRNVFERAQQAKPCLLFFDELDSLAPKRGVDTSGVTDRVVNQLLTELDGVEGRNGVWVLGASSRPDLIDAALLRPGRMDRAIFCSVPSQDDRVEILKVLSRDVSIDSSVFLEELAGSTSGFTGADLHALVYNAQMCSLKKDPTAKDHLLLIEHFAAALEETKPSLSKADRIKYQQIFQRFQSPEASSTRLASQAQKVTFA